MSLTNDWSYSTDTLQVEVNDGRQQLDSTSDDSDDQDDARTISEVPTRQLRTASNFTLVNPIIELREDDGSSAFQLTFEKDDLLNSVLCSLEGRRIYEVLTRTNGTAKTPGNRIMTCLYRVGNQEAS
jgi:hypothetical protein